MLSYRAEIVVAADRYVCLQLPPHFPEGRATVLVHFSDATGADSAETSEATEHDPEDIEWWEEFEGERG